MNISGGGIAQHEEEACDVWMQVKLKQNSWFTWEKWERKTERMSRWWQWEEDWCKHIYMHIYCTHHTHKHTHTCRVRLISFIDRSWRPSFNKCNCKTRRTGGHGGPSTEGDTCGVNLTWAFFATPNIFTHMPSLLSCSTTLLFQVSSAAVCCNFFFLYPPAPKGSVLHLIHLLL